MSENELPPASEAFRHIFVMSTAFSFIFLSVLGIVEIAAIKSLDNDLKAVKADVKVLMSERADRIKEAEQRAKRPALMGY